MCCPSHSCIINSPWTHFIISQPIRRTEQISHPLGILSKDIGHVFAYHAGGLKILDMEKRGYKP